MKKGINNQHIYIKTCILSFSFSERRSALLVTSSSTCMTSSEEAAAIAVLIRLFGSNSLTAGSPVAAKEGLSVMTSIGSPAGLATESVSL